MKACFYLIFAISLACTAAAQQAPNPGGRLQLAPDREQYLQPVVLNGTLATASSQTRHFTVYLQMYNAAGERSGSCTGILVSRTLVMTAGHCLAGDGMRVVVKFGLGGAHGFTHEIQATGYRSWFPSVYGDPQQASTDLRSDYLSYDSESQREFHENIEQRTSWLNFGDSNFIYYENFLDIALIKIEGAPSAYTPIEIYNGEFTYNQTAHIAGFGISHRQASERTTALRWMQGTLTGHYTRPDETTLAMQYHSPGDGGFCFGDSGGPLVVTGPNGNFQLVGINVMLINNCANSSYAVYIKYFRRWFTEKAAELNETIAI